MFDYMAFNIVTFDTIRILDFYLRTKQWNKNTTSSQTKPSFIFVSEHPGVT